jgi:hypothetical protein
MWLHKMVNLPSESDWVADKSLGEDGVEHALPVVMTIAAGRGHKKEQ